MNKFIQTSLLLTLTAYCTAEVLKNPTSYSSDLYKEVILNGDYDPSIDHPSKFLDFKYGERVASPKQIEDAINAYKLQSNKIKLINYGTTHEGRPLHALIISSSDNIAQLDTIKQNLSALADARKTSEREAKKIIDSLPAVAWMAYSIHGLSLIHI